MTAERTDQISVADGSFEAFVAGPEEGTGPGILLLHEIFGIAESWRQTLTFLARTLEG